MKIEGHTSYLNSDNNKNSVEVNFGRVMKFIITGGGTQVTYEFSPLKKETLTPRLEALVNCKPQVAAGMNTSTPGFSAKLTIYNPGTDIIQILTKTSAFPAKINANTAYTSTNRPSVEVHAGYWDFENKTEVYSGLFTGYLNSSSLYRKGVDTVLELWCHNIDLKVKDFASWIAKNAPESDKIEALKKSVVELNDDYTYLSAVKKLIMDLAETRSPIPVASTSFNYNAALNQVLPANIVMRDPKNNMSFRVEDNSDKVEDWMRSNSNWIHIAFIGEKFKDGYTNYTADTTLEKEFSLKILKKFKFIKPDKPSDAELDKQIKRLMEIFTEHTGIVVGVDKLKFPPIDEFYHWYFWVQVDNGPYSAASSSNPSKGTVVIEDFQNFIDPPTCNGNGQIVMKMMFNPKCEPLKNVVLRWDQYKTNNIITSKTQGGMVNASMGYYAPLIQAGRYSAAVYALAQGSAGDIFDNPMKIISVVHELSTTTNKWSTTVTTAGLDYTQTSTQARKAGYE